MWQVLIYQHLLKRLKILAPTTALTSVENKIPNVSYLVKKPDYNTQISENEN